MAGVACILAGILLITNIYGFYRHPTVGAALVHRQERSAHRIQAAGRCAASFPSSPAGATSSGNLPLPDTSGAPTATSGPGQPTVYALLKATKIGLVAPVVQGTDDPQLSVAVGHLPASSWPGTTGTSVLAAHDVTWFSHIDQPAPGDEVSVVTACQTFVYRWTVMKSSTQGRSSTRPRRRNWC